MRTLAHSWRRAGAGLTGPLGRPRQALASPWSRARWALGWIFGCLAWDFGVADADAGESRRGSLLPFGGIGLGQPAARTQIRKY